MAIRPVSVYPPLKEAPEPIHRLKGNGLVPDQLGIRLNVDAIIPFKVIFVLRKTTQMDKVQDHCHLTSGSAHATPGVRYWTISTYYYRSKGASVGRSSPGILL